MNQPLGRDTDLLVLRPSSPQTFFQAFMHGHFQGNVACLMCTLTFVTTCKVHAWLPGTKVDSLVKLLVVENYPADV